MHYKARRSIAKETPVRLLRRMFLKYLLSSLVAAPNLRLRMYTRLVPNLFVGLFSLAVHCQCNTAVDFHPRPGVSGHRGRTFVHPG